MTLRLRWVDGPMPVALVHALQSADVALVQEGQPCDVAVLSLSDWPDNASQVMDAPRLVVLVDDHQLTDEGMPALRAALKQMPPLQWLMPRRMTEGGSAEFLVSNLQSLHHDAGADRDRLTGLLTRTAFLRRLDEQAGQPVVLLVVDIDDLASVNLEVGDVVADQHLAAAALTLVSHAPDGAFVGRVAPDEFGVAYPADDRDPRQVAEELRSRVVVRDHALPQGGVITMTATCGVVTGTRGHSVDLLDQATMAVVVGKARGGDRTTLLDDYRVAHGEQFKTRYLRDLTRVTVDKAINRVMRQWESSIEDALDRLHIDPLTQLTNAGYAEVRGTAEVAETERLGESLVLLFVDIDEFGLFNKRLGQVAGNEVLRRVASTLSETVASRASRGWVARLGGEEMGVVLPGYTRATAQLVAEDIRRAVEQLPPLNPDDRRRTTVTVSVGGAELRSGWVWHRLVTAASLAVQDAKREGRNRVAWLQRDDVPPGPASGGGPHP